MPTKSGTAQPVGRREDFRHLTGRGVFVDDIRVDGQLHAQFVRSNFAHGVIRSIDLSEASAMPGVLAVFTGKDLHEAGIGNIPYLPMAGFAVGTPLETPRPALAIERVRYVGEQIALVVAHTREQAVDAAERVVVEIDELPAVVDVESATLPGAPILWPQAADNTVLTFKFGDDAALQKAFSGAAHVTRLKLRNNRVLANPMELRAVVASYDSKEQRFELVVSSQGVSYYLRGLGEGTLRIKPSQVHVRTYDVGGAFGNKELPYPEDIAVLHAARTLRRPVKWSGTRSEHFLSDNHARDALIEGALALDREGNFLAVHATVSTCVGAYCSYVAPNTAIRNTTIGLPQVYKTPLVGTTHKIVVTNTAPTGPYRGAGREQGVLVVEALIDQAARELGMDHAELRRRNLIPASSMPYATPVGRTYDSGDFEGLLDKTLGLADWIGFAERAAATASKGLIRGRGLAMFIEPVGGALLEGAKVRFGEDGSVRAVLASQSSGQGHETTFSQIISERLGVPFEKVTIQTGDSNDLPRGFGSFASRTMFMAGSATALTCDEVVAKGKRFAASLFEVAEADVDFSAGMFRVRGTDLEVDLLQLASRLRREKNLPDALDSGAEFNAREFAFPNGCHVCEIEIDPETGDVTVDRYAAVDDCGTVINPTIVHGQVHGGVAQGIGQALMESIVYDEGGQLLTASFQDYAIPRAADLPEPQVDFHAVPSPSSPIGAKGVGESGVTGSVAAVSNAVRDALARAGVRAAVDMPFTRERIWRALQSETRDR